jgi:ABC-2 type transport system permease protein
VFGIGLAFVALATGVAYRLVAVRDIGGGLLADRPGRVTASPWLSSAPALALRLQRGVLIAWTGAMLLMGLVVGSLGSSIDAFLDSPSARDMIAKLGGSTSLIDAFFGTELGAAAFIISIFAIQSVLRLRTEESALRAEPLLATALGRRGFVASHLLVSAVGSVWLLLVLGLGMGVTGSAALHDGSWFGRLLAAALTQAPAVLVMVGLTVAAFGLVPRFAAAGWAFLVAFLLIGELGPIFDLDPRLLDVSPFVHVPRIGEFSVTPLVWLTLVAAALIAIGVESFRRRDLD